MHPLPQFNKHYAVGALSVTSFLRLVRSFGAYHLDKTVGGKLQRVRCLDPLLYVDPTSTFSP